MGFRVLDDIDNKIIRAIITVGAAEGVRKASAKRVAAMCDVTHTVVLSHFGSTRGSWDAAAEYVDTTGMEKMRSLFVQGLDRTAIWDAMLDYLIEHPDDALFYSSYISTFGFDPTETNPRAEEFYAYARACFRTTDERKCLMLWDYVTTMEFYYAEKIIHGFLKNDEAERATIREIVFRGVDNM